MFPVISVNLYDRDGSYIKEVQLTRFWYSPPKILIENGQYFVRITNDDNIEAAMYRRTCAVKKIDT